MLSGGSEGEAGIAADKPAEQHTPLLTRVQVASYEATPMAREVVIHGSTQARRSVSLRAETAGEVEKLIARRGSEVKAGELLVRLAEDDRRERLAQAKALLRQRELEYEAARSLKKQGLKAESQLAESFSMLESARAQLRSAELNLARAKILAPFDGVVQQHHVEVGDYLMAGDPVLLIIERNPLLVGGELSEREVGQIRLGMVATARLPDGSSLPGRISYIAPAAASETRSFRVEMEADNPQGIAAGVTATIHVPLGEVNAYKLSPALLSLSDAGVIGVKSVDKDNTVQFHEVELLRSDNQGLWVAGLPQELRLITVGQGFVRAGDRVDAVVAE
jgi:multidrug efflux system membrane fusion protein